MQNWHCAHRAPLIPIQVASVMRSCCGLIHQHRIVHCPVIAGFSFWWWKLCMRPAHFNGIPLSKIRCTCEHTIESSSPFADYWIASNYTSATIVKELRAGVRLSSLTAHNAKQKHYQQQQCTKKKTARGGWQQRLDRPITHSKCHASDRSLLVPLTCFWHLQILLEHYELRSGRLPSWKELAAGEKII